MLSTPPNKPSSLIKYHAFTQLTTVDTNYLIQFWCKFIPQIKITLNLLQTQRVDRTKSAYEALNNRKYNWNYTPLAPIGARAFHFYRPTNPVPLILDMLTQRWSTTVYFKATGYCTNVDTYKLFPVYGVIPLISENDRTILAARDLMIRFKGIAPVSANQKITDARCYTSSTRSF